MVKHLIAAIKEALVKYRIEALDKEVEFCTKARAKLKQRALKAQAKRDALAQGAK